MRQYEWDKSIEELCSSKEEVQELKEVVSLLRSMPEPVPLLLFRPNSKRVDGKSPLRRHTP